MGTYTPQGGPKMKEKSRPTGRPPSGTQDAETIDASGLLNKVAIERGVQGRKRGLFLVVLGRDSTARGKVCRG